MKGQADKVQISPTGFLSEMTFFFLSTKYKNSMLCRAFRGERRRLTTSLCGTLLGPSSRFSTLTYTFGRCPVPRWHSVHALPWFDTNIIHQSASLALSYALLRCLCSFPVLVLDKENRTLISSSLRVALSQVKLFLDLLTSGKYRVSSRMTEDGALVTALPTTTRVSWYAPAFCYSNKYPG